MPYELVLILYSNFRFPNITKSIGFRMIHFLTDVKSIYTSVIFSCYPFFITVPISAVDIAYSCYG